MSPLFAICLLVLAFALMVSEAINSRRWKKKWPPIDDDEFLRRCGPGTNRSVALKVRRIISEHLRIDYERIYPEQNFVNDLFCD